MLSKAIKLNFKLIKDYLLSFLFIAALLIALGGSLGMNSSILMLIFQLIMLYCELKICIILFYDSKYGKGSDLFNQLPLTINQNILSSMIVGTISMGICYIAAFFSNFSATWSGWVSMKNLPGFLLEELTEDGAKSIALVGLGAVVYAINIMAFIAMMFAAMTVYNKIKKGESDTARKVACIVAFFVGNVACELLLGLLLMVINTENLAISMTVEGAVYVVFIALSYVITKKFMEARYQ